MQTRARSTKSATAGVAARAASAVSLSTSNPGSGIGSGETGHSCSALMRSGAREVASTRTPGAASSSVAIDRRRGFERLELLQVVEHEQESLAAKVGEHALLKAEPTSFAHTQDAAISGKSSAAASAPASVTRKTPSGNVSSESAAAASASRVLPTPPGPVSVTSRVASRARRSRRAAMSSSRPMRAVGCRGRLVGCPSRLFSGGNVVGNPGMASCQISSAATRSRSRCVPRERAMTPSGSRSPTASRTAAERST